MAIPLHPTQLAEDQRSAPAVVAVAADLMFASRIRAAGDAAGIAIHLARGEDDTIETARTLGARLVLVDLDSRAFDPAALIRRLREPESNIAATVIAFVSHVRTDAIAAARAAGADRVLARSAFIRELPALLAGG